MDEQAEEIFRELPEGLRVKQEEIRKRLMILANGMSVAQYNSIPPTVMKKGLAKTMKPGAIVTAVTFKGEHHFPGYQYLGPGTRYKTRQALGIEPINDLDRIAMYHDSQYSRTGAKGAAGLPVIPIGRSPLRGVADLGAGSAMMNAAYNPWSDLTWTDRGYAAGAGAVLIAQGALRLHPLTMAPMALLDALFY